MFMNRLRKWAALLMPGAMMLQTTGCIEAAATAGATASVVTAGGVLYLISRILGD